MRISEANVAFHSAHHQEQEHIREETLRVWVGNERPDFEGDDRPRQTASPPAVIVHLSPAARYQPPSPVSATSEPLEPTSQEDPKLRAIRLVLEALTGKNIRVAAFTPAEAPAPAPITAPAAASGQPPRQGWGLEYDYLERYREAESVQFAASGVIRTTDGQSVPFTMGFALRREFVQETSLSIRAGDALLVDPLVINFNGPAAQLTDQRFLFDLDMDGTPEKMPLLGAGSGFLALDRNGDGKINHGGELFGPATGNGFGELRHFDSDGNGWLDENDPMFEKLRIWMKDTAGNDALYTLRKKNIGALLLAAAATPFSLTDNANALQGKLRETSIYLTESGSVGTIQELDIAV